MKRVIIESPYAGDEAFNTAYVRACLRDCLLRDEAPYASHALYTLEGVLSDAVAEERERGMIAGFAWGAIAELIAVYVDRGVSDGMKRGIARHERNGIPIEYRTIGGRWAIPTGEPVQCPMNQRERGMAPRPMELLPNGDHVCWYCGSWDRAEYRAHIDRIVAGEIPASYEVNVPGISERSYPCIEVNDGRHKIYIHRDGVKNAGEGAIKVYVAHLTDDDIVATNRAIKLGRGDANG